MSDAVAVAEEVVVPSEEVVITPAQADEDADFDSGFADAPTAETPPAEEPPPVVADPVVEAAPEVKYRQVTEAEWGDLESRRAEQAKKLDQAFGKMGGLERTLSEIQKATPAGTAVELTDDTVAELAEAFPELGGLVLTSLKKMASKMKGTGSPAAATLDPQQIEAAVTTRLIALQTEALEDDHADWREVTGAPDSNNAYRQWLAAQPADYQQKLVSTNSAAVISKSITKFKDQAAAAATAASATATAAAKAASDKAAKTAAANTRTQRLEAAATPRGTEGHSATETEDEFEAGFKSG